MRFYPDSVPEFEHEPTKDKFKIDRIPNYPGHYLISLVEIVPGDIVFSFTGYLIDFITQYSLQLEKNLHIHDPFAMGKLAHSCSPNSRCEIKKRLIIAISNIHVNDPVTIDYTETEDTLFKTFECQCSSPKCRNIIMGKKDDIQTLNLPAKNSI